LPNEHGHAWNFVSVDDICLIQSFGGEMHLSQTQGWQQLCGSHSQGAALVILAHVN